MAVGRNARGIVAIGENAEGIIAIGVTARGVVAIGLSAGGILLGVGVVAVGTVAVSAACSLGLVAYSLVVAAGGTGGAFFESWVAAAWGIAGLFAVVLVQYKHRGSWAPAPAPPPLVPLAELQRGHVPRGWIEVALLAVTPESLVVGDRDGEQSVRAPAAVLRQAEALRRRRPRPVLVHVEATQELGGRAPADYRAAAQRQVSLQADEIRLRPRRPLWPQHADELRFVLWRSSLAVVGVATLIAFVVNACG